MSAQPTEDEIDAALSSMGGTTLMRRAFRTRAKLLGIDRALDEWSQWCIAAGVRS